MLQQVKAVFFLTLALTSAASIAHADDERVVKWGGSARIRLEHDSFNNYSNVRQMTWMRFRPFVNIQAEPGLNFYFEPQFAKAMGQNSVAANSTSAATTPEQVSGGTSDPIVGVHQAYIEYALSSAFTLKAGRQVLSYGDELILGALEWNNVARAFDAIKIRHSSEMVKNDFFYSKLVDMNVTSGGNGDYDFMGNYNSFSGLAGIKEFDFYLLYLNDTRGTAPAPVRLGTAGLRAKSMFDEAFDYRAEFTQQFGTLAGSTAGAYGTQGDFEAGYTFAGSSPVRIGLEGFYADKDYNQLFPTAHKWLGVADVFGRRNIYGAKLLSSVKFSDQFKLMTDVHRFYRADETLSAYNTSGSAIAGSNTGGKALGTEIDCVAQYELSPRTSIQGGGGILFPSDTMKAVHNGKPAFAYVSWDVKF